MDNFTSSIAGSLLASLIVGILAWIRDRLVFFRVHKSPFWRQGSLVILVFLWFIINISLSSFVIAKGLFSFLFTMSTFVLLYIGYKEVSQYWRVGLESVDKSIETGINYRKSLSLCKTRLRFLGTGARNLTRAYLKNS